MPMRGLPDTKSRAVNICSGGTISMKELARMVLDIVGRSDLEPERLPLRRGHVERASGGRRPGQEFIGLGAEGAYRKGPGPVRGMVQCLRDPAV